MAFEEPWLFVETGLAVLAYAIWVGLTGAALSFGADAADVSLSPTPWTGTHTVIVAVAALTWLVVPATLATRLLVDRLTNESDNLHQHYRFQRPVALLVPPAALFIVVAGAVVALDPVPWPLLVALVAASAFVLVRTVAYGYRVFALSAPRALQGVVFLAALALAAALLTGGAVLVGREAYFVAVVASAGEAVGVSGLGSLVGGRVGAAGISLPTVVAVAVAGAVGLPALYVLAQTVAAGVARLREPDVPRAQLRTGQRHPEFARPTTGTVEQPTPSPTSSTTSVAPNGGSTATRGDDAGDVDTSAPDVSSGLGGDRESSGVDDAEDRDGENDEEGLIEDVSHTRVYTPPGGDADGERGDSDASESGNETAGGESIGFGGSASPDEDAPTEIVTDACPACGEPLDPDADYGFCPACGESL